MAKFHPRLLIGNGIFAKATFYTVITVREYYITCYCTTAILIRGLTDNGLETPWKRMESFEK